MCTQTRTAPPSSRSALIASSKSRAVGGSIVNVGRSRRSRRAHVVRRTVRSRARLALDQRIEAAAQPAIEHQRLEHVARDVRPPDPAHDAAVAGARAVRRHEHEVAGAGVQRGLGSVDVDPPPAPEEQVGGEESPAALEHGDERIGPAARAPAARAAGGGRLPARAHVPCRATVLTRDVERLVALLGLRVVLGLDVGLDAGALLDAATAQVATAGGEVLAHGDVERAAVGELSDLLEDALAERPGADDLGAVAVLQGAGDDLRGRRRLAVDEHHDRDLAVDRVPLAPRTRASGARGRRSTRSCRRR